MIKFVMQCPSLEINLTCSDENGPGSSDSGKHCSNSISGISIKCKHFRAANEEYTPLLGVRVASQTKRKNQKGGRKKR
jgi:hypothetical protein